FSIPSSHEQTIAGDNCVYVIREGGPFYSETGTEPDDLTTHLLCYSTSGEILWHKRFTSQYAYINRMRLDENLNLFIIGSFSKELIVDGMVLASSPYKYSEVYVM